MILTILGGSAQSTPVLAAALADAVPDAAIEIRLAGRDPWRLRAVQRACRLLTRGTHITAETALEEEWESALRGSDVVLVQTRIGGYPARKFDETFPLAFGIPGDEGLGPGGLSAAVRSWPAMRLLFEQIRSYAPSAETILLSSPSSLLLRLAAGVLPGWPIKGTCELPWTTLRALCNRFGQDPNTCAFDYEGVNHLGFLYNVHGSRDLLDAYVQSTGLVAFPSPALVRAFGAFPLRYLRLHFELSEVVHEQSGLATPRAQQLAAIAEQVFPIFLRSDEATVRQATAMRPAPWYPEAVVPLLLTALGKPVSQPVFMSMADVHGDVRERACTWQGDAWTPRPRLKVPPTAAAKLVEQFAAYERMAAQAVLHGTADALTEALALHPWVNSPDASLLASRILNQSFHPATCTEDVACLS